MVSLFGKKSVNWVGVDIGSSSVKVVSLSKSGNVVELGAYAVVPLPPTAVVDGNVQELQPVADAVAKAAKICGVKQGGAVTAVPSSSVIMKRLELSKELTEYELEEQIKIEADQFIPYSLDEVALDFEVLGESPSHSALNELLLVACRRDDVDQREDVVNSAGLKCEVVDVDMYAIERILPLLEGEQENSDDQLVAVVDIGAATLTLNVLRGGQITYNREQSFGGGDLTTNIHHQSGMAIEEVEQALRQGELSSEMHESMVLPFRVTVAQQVSRALQFFYSSGAQHQINRIYICGGTASIVGLSDVLADELGVPVAVADPFTKMKVGAKVNPARLEKDMPSLVKACGLALRSLEA